jgi:hypothetical protein
MKNFKKTLLSLLILSSLSTAGTFEQNGVKEGNNRVSASARFSVDEDGDTNLQFLGQYGRFITDDIELMTDIFTTKNSTSSATTYLLGLGANYYFAKTPTLTPYVGGQYYRVGKTGNSNSVSNSARVVFGAHKFLTENFAITPEAGALFFDFTEYSQSYLNVYLTYFFD